MMVLLLVILFFLIFQNISSEYSCHLRRDEKQCGGHGNCMADGKCDCKVGWTGTVCSIHQCKKRNPWDPQVCNKRGECIGPNKCSCDKDHTGEDCEFRICFGEAQNKASVCSGHGTCLSDGTCQCQSEYFGNDCSVAPSTDECGSGEKSSCSSHGACNKGACKCQFGYYGPWCEYFDCFAIRNDNEKVCHHRGKCSAGNSCHCQNGYFGHECECAPTTCHTGQCNSHGICLMCNTRDVALFRRGCICDEGYSEPSCMPKCFGVTQNHKDVCNGHGECTALDTCQCEAYYSGESCNEFKCFGVKNTDPSVCHGHGTCVENNVCECESDGYFGDDCSLWKCGGTNHWEPEVCGGSKKGKCVGPNVCECYDQDFIGEHCEVAACNGIAWDDMWVCNGRGICEIHPVDPNMCQCSDEFRGEFCEYPKCYGVWSEKGNEKKVCGGNGKCVDSDTCACYEGYYGKKCEHKMKVVSYHKQFFQVSDQQEQTDQSVILLIQIMFYSTVMFVVVSFFCGIVWIGRIADLYGGKLFSNSEKTKFQNALFGGRIREDGSGSDGDNFSMFSDDSVYTATTGSVISGHRRGNSLNTSFFEDDVSSVGDRFNNEEIERRMNKLRKEGLLNFGDDDENLLDDLEE